MYNVRTSPSTPLPPDASSSAAPLNPPPPENTSASTTLGSSSAVDAPSTNLGMYSPPTGTHSMTPFPTSEHPHFAPPHQGRFSERLVHQIHFKVFTHSNNTQELFVMEIPATGISRTRDPQHFFFAMTGQWEWSQHTADYWRHYFGVPMRHGINPFEDYFPPDMEPAITQQRTTFSDQYYYYYSYYYYYCYYYYCYCYYDYYYYYDDDDNNDDDDYDYVYGYDDYYYYYCYYDYNYDYYCYYCYY